MRWRRRFIAFFLACLCFSTLAYADHVAIVYCELDSQHNVVVVAADSDAPSGIGAGAKKGQSCSQVVHEISTQGYELMDTDVSESEGGLIVFVLKKPHK